MKKITLTLLAAALSFNAAQAQFFTPTTYRGAFGATDWTSGWANFDPKSTVYPGDAGTTFNTITIAAGDITTNTTWTKNNANGVRNVYRISGFVYVKNASLTIEAGTIVRGSGSGTIIVTRGAQIFANGTAAEPIIFTSNAPAGNNRTNGNWGGIVLCGAAPHNIASGANAPVEGGIAATHGGTNADDNSGVLKYIRIEFPGQPLTTASNSEINGLSLYSVGRGTQIDHVQVSFSGDDAFEWFGGTVDAKYLIATNTQDDDFDTDNGFRGRIQFALSQRNPANSDQSGSTGFESDNDAQGSTRTPQTRPIFSNVTIIGPVSSNQPTLPTGHNFTRGAHLRRNTGCSVYNSVITGFPQAGLFLDGRRAVANAFVDTLQFQNNLIAGLPAGSFVRLAASSDTTIGTTLVNQTLVRTWSSNHDNDTLAVSDNILLTAPFSLTAPNFLPQANSPLLAGASFANPRLGGVTSIRKNINNNLHVSIYPNPSADKSFVSVELNKASQVSVRIYDNVGKQLWQSASERYEAGQQDILLPTHTLATGIYSVVVTTEAGQNATRLIVNR